jgi:hypothetical protein
MHRPPWTATFWQFFIVSLASWSMRAADQPFLRSYSIRCKQHLRVWQCGNAQSNLWTIAVGAVVDSTLATNALAVSPEASQPELLESTELNLFTGGTCVLK